MSGLKPYSQNGWEAVKLLIYRFQKLHKLGHQEIGAAVGRNRATVSSDLNRTASNSEAERRLFELYGNWLLGIARKHPGYPNYLRSLFEEILTKEALQEICPAEPHAGARSSGPPGKASKFEVVSDQVTLRRHSAHSVDDHAVRYDADGLPRLGGLSVLVRPSNETVEVLHADGTETLEYGVSVSLLNVVPEYVQTGDYHPLFKLRQRGTGRNFLDIEGIVLCQDDRIVLSGRDDGQKRNMLASIYFRREAAITYRSPAKGHAAESLFGVMLGVSNSKNHFCSLFTLFALPGGLVPESDLEDDRAVASFEQIYNQGRNATGVFPEREIPDVLTKLGIEDARPDVAAMLKKARGRRIFSVAV